MLTFMFTDLVGSTRLWEDDPERMRPALTRHDFLLREAVTAAGGRTFKSTGDGLAAVFSSTVAAAQAALAGQRSLLAEPWSEGVRIEVRMGIHTGPAEARDGDFYGQTLNRAARLTAAAGAAQILLSQAAREECGDRLADICADGKVSLVDLGSHRLKDLSRPEPIWQLSHPDLPAEYGPIQSLTSPNLPNNLPQFASSFIGREKELGQVRELVEKHRLVTLTGPGGTGKTRLTLQAAADLFTPERFPDGAYFVDLAPVRDPDMVPDAVAKAMGIKEEQGTPLTGTLTETLKPRRLLLVLDNCEHLIEAAARLADALLRAVPGVTLLATSRESLNIDGEQIFPVPTLALPVRNSNAVGDSDVPPIDQLRDYEAVRLFVERAATARPDFALSGANAAAVAHICWRLDGIPLGLELAAARVRSLSVVDIEERLNDRFRLLVGGSRAALPRQQTLRALIDWSWQLLTPSEQRLLARLSTFVGGWTLAAAESVCGFDPLEEWETLDRLTGLVEKSLVVADEAPDGSFRYRLLETVRAYALEVSDRNDEAQTMRDRHRNWCLAFAEQAEPHLSGPDQRVWFQNLENETENLRAALDGSGEAGTAEAALAALRIVRCIWLYWHHRGLYVEGRARSAAAVKTALALPESERPRPGDLANAYRAEGIFAWMQGDYPGARALYVSALEHFRAANDERGISKALLDLGNLSLELGDYDTSREYLNEALVQNRQEAGKYGLGAVASTLQTLGIIATLQGEFASARSYLEECLAIARELRDQSSVGSAYCNLGILAVVQEEYELAVSRYEDGLQIFRDIKYTRGITACLGNLGRAAIYLGDSKRARERYTEALALRQETSDRQGIASALHGLGMTALLEGDYPGAASSLWDSLRQYHQIGDPRGMIEALESTAELMRYTGYHERAVSILSANAAAREAIGVPLSARERRDVEATLDACRAALSERQYEAARVSGQALSSVEDSAREALDALAALMEGGTVQLALARQDGYL